jgi:hypothetical protein
LKSPTDHYRILGIDTTATAAEIKQAYRAAAKKAHPDAGGSESAMEAVNEAYKTLSDPLARRAYDYARSSPAPEPEPSRSAGDPRQTTSPASKTHKPTNVRRAYRYRTVPHADPRDVRRYVWRHLEEFGLLAFAGGAVLSFASARAADASTQLLLGVLGFIPVYWLILQLVYLAVPDLKFRTYFTIRHPLRADGGSRWMLVAVATLWIPLGPLWTLFVSTLAQVAFA